MPNTPPAGARSRAGFTLIEVMVVVTILGLLATLVVSSLGDRAAEARCQKAATDARLIADAVRLFHAQRGAIPALSDLTTRDGKGRRYLDELPPDPWGSEYLLLDPGDPPEIVVTSPGPNKTPGDEDDVTSRAGPPR